MIRAVSQFNNNSCVVNFNGSRLSAVKGKRAEANFVDAYACLGGMVFSLGGSSFAVATEKPPLQAAVLGISGLFLGVLLGAMLGVIKK